MVQLNYRFATDLLDFQLFSLTSLITWLPSLHFNSTRSNILVNVRDPLCMHEILLLCKFEASIIIYKCL